MLSKKKNIMSKNVFTESKPNTIITGTTIKGEISSQGDFRIDGQLVGSIKCQGKIVVGQTGSIEGEIECQNADISGILKARMKVDELLTLKSTSKLHGDVITNKISIEPGAVFSGTCNMDGGGSSNHSLNADRNQQKPKEKGAE